MKAKRIQRDKAFLGAIIGAIAGIAGSAIAASSSKRSTKKQTEEQQRQQNKNDTLEMAQNLSASYGNQDYIDDFQNKVKFKTGGKMKTKKTNYNDRVTVAKKFKCGGRKKAAWGASDTSALISGVGGALSNVTGTLIGNNVDTTVKPGTIYKGIPKERIKEPDYIVNPDNLFSSNNTVRPQYEDRIQQAMRCGGRKRKKEGGVFERISTNIKKARERYGDRMAEGRRRNAEYQRQQNAKAAAKRKLINDTNAAVEASKRAYRKARPNSTIYK